MRTVIVIRFPVERTLKFNNHLPVRRYEYILRDSTNKKKRIATIIKRISRTVYVEGKMTLVRSGVTHITRYEHI